MIRQMLRLAAEAVKVEIDHWKSPAREPAIELVPAVNEAVEVVPAPAPTRSMVDPATAKWSSSAFLSAALKSSTCPDCDAPKSVGWYRCGACTEVAVAAAKAAGRLQ